MRDRPIPSILYICVTPNAAGTKAGVKVWEIYGPCATLLHEANGVPVTNTWVPMTAVACAFNLTGLLDKLGFVKDAYAPNGAEVRLKSLSNGAKGEFRLYSGGPEATFELPLGGCNEPGCCDQ